MKCQSNKLIYHYQKALYITPNNIAVYNKIAEIYYEQGELEKALELCQFALHIEPNLALAPKCLSKLLQTLGFEGKEVNICQEFLQQKCDLTAFYEGFGNMLLKFKHIETIADIKTWKDKVRLGYILKEKKQWEEAIFAYLNAIEIEPVLAWPHSEVNSIINYCFSPLPDVLDKITNLYKQAIQERLTHWFAYVTLGDMLTKQGNLDEAIAAYKTATNRTTKFHQDYTINSRNFNKSYNVNFLIIGIGKAGTTSLFNYLCQHPQVLTPIKKEIDFFHSNFELGLDWYLSHFPPLLQTGGFITGEATPWYLSNIGAEKKVFQLFPNIKLIVVLRNPVARAISHYYMNRSITETRSLEEAMNSELEILRDIKDITNLSEISDKYWSTQQGYLWCGLYTYFLEKWMTLFPKEQFLILRNESLKKETAKTMKQVFDFLEISNDSFANYPKYNSSSYPNTNNELRQKLADFFQPHNQRLEDYLGIKFNWL